MDNVPPEVRGLNDALNAINAIISCVRRVPGLLNAAGKAVIRVATLCCKLGTLEGEMDALWLMKENLETHASLQTEEPPGQRDRLTRWVGQVEELNGQVPRPGAPPSRPLGRVSRAILLHRVLSMYETGGELVVPPPSSYPPPVGFWETSGKRLHPEDATLVRVRRHLATSAIHLLGVTGRPRIGKTSLLQEINNGLADLPARCNGYGVVICVTVSPEPNRLSKIQMEIGARLGLSDLSADGDVTSQSAILRRVLTRRRFLLLLDDVWAQLDLEQLGIPCRRRGAKIVFATPINKTCSDMRPDESVFMEPLGADTSWRLFWDTINRPELEERVKRKQSWLDLSKKLINQQGGVPGAIVALAQTMSQGGAVTKEECWAYFMLESSSGHCQMGREERANWTLKFGFLEPQDKKCFLYCSLFPCGYEIDERQLADYWMSEDFVSADGRVIDTVRGECSRIICSLVHECWLSDGTAEGKVRMDKDPHQFAISQHDVNRFVVSADRQLESVPDIGRWSDAERVSLMGNRITSLPAPPGKCPRLLTLFVSRNRDLKFEANGVERRPQGTVRTFFSAMNHLKVLDLSFTSVDALPADIHVLAQLKYLNLSHTRICSLTGEVRRLRELTHLDLSCTESLSEIPAAEISQLEKLVTLNMYDSACYLPGADGETEQGRRWSWLLNLSRLKELGVSIDIQRSLVISIPPRLSGFIKFLMLKGSPECAPGELNLLERQLGGLEALKLWDIPLSTLVVGSHLQLQGLHRLHIQGCHQLKDIRWAQQLPNLEEIHVQDCRAIEKLLAPERNGGCMEELKEIHLQDLPKLKTIHSRCRACYFPSLRRFKSRECPRLEKPCFKAKDAPELKRVDPDLFG